jgi:YHS domain-containing protein
MTKCAVCECSVIADEMPIFSEYKGRQYIFCSTGCKEEFEYDQEKYLKNTDLEEISTVLEDNSTGDLS